MPPCFLEGRLEGSWDFSIAYTSSHEYLVKASKSLVVGGAHTDPHYYCRGELLEIISVGNDIIDANQSIRASKFQDRRTRGLVPPQSRSIPSVRVT